MKIQKVARYEEASVLLEQGVDFEAEQLMGDALTGNKLKTLGRVALYSIATANGFSGVTWSDFEHDGTIKAMFRKDLYL